MAAIGRYSRKADIESVGPQREVAPKRDPPPRRPLPAKARSYGLAVVAMLLQLRKQVRRLQILHAPAGRKPHLAPRTPHLAPRTPAHPRNLTRPPGRPMKKNRVVPVPSRLRRFRERRRHLLTHLAIAALGAFIFVRIVAKEKNRRQRYLLLRLADQKAKLAELEAAANAPAAPVEVDESQAPYEATAVGQAA